MGSNEQGDLEQALELRPSCSGRKRIGFMDTNQLNQLRRCAFFSLPSLEMLLPSPLQIPIPIPSPIPIPIPIPMPNLTTELQNACMRFHQQPVCELASDSFHHSRNKAVGRAIKSARQCNNNNVLGNSRVHKTQVSTHPTPASISTSTSSSKVSVKTCIHQMLVDMRTLNRWLSAHEDLFIQTKELEESFQDEGLDRQIADLHASIYSRLKNVCSLFTDQVDQIRAHGLKPQGKAMKKVNEVKKALGTVKELYHQRFESMAPLTLALALPAKDGEEV